jgi:hypothetical protein
VSDNWQYKSNFVDAMWLVFRNSVGMGLPEQTDAGLDRGARLTVTNNPLGRNMETEVYLPDRSPERNTRAAVLDMRGNTVKTLAPTRPGAAAWDGTDDQGARVRPGCYIVRLHDGQAMAAARVMVVE